MKGALKEERAAGRVGKGRILVVDDEKLFCQFLSSFLGEFYHVDVALNLSQAEECLTHSSPDLVLLDAVLPGESGISYLRRIKIRDPDLNVFVVTALLDEDLKEEAFQFGAMKVIFKPIDLMAFRSAIEEVIGGPLKGSGYAAGEG